MPTAYSDLPNTLMGSARLNTKDVDPSFVLPPANVSANSRLKRQAASFGTVATTGTAETLILAPVTGTLADALLIGHDTLAQSDTNFITATITNRSNGNAVMLASTPAGINTTKTTGGAAWTAFTPYALNLTATAANLNVTKNDVLDIVLTVTGTLANTVTLAMITLGFNPST